MSLAVLSNVFASAIAALFFLAGVLHVAAPQGLRAAYRRWDFANGFQYAAGAAQLLAAVFLAVPQTRIWGGILAALILFVAVCSLLNRRKYVYAIPAMLVMVALAPAMAGPL